MAARKQFASSPCVSFEPQPIVDLQATQVVESTGDRAAAYQLARHFESQDKVEEAIKYYSRSGCYSNAIRLAKEHNLKQLMLGLALRSTKADMIEVGCSIG